jgi:negative regulator of sigma E activity
MRLLNGPIVWARLLTVLALVATVLVVVNMFLYVRNQKLNREVAERQQFIVQTAQVQGVAKEVVTALANLAIKNNDEQLKQLLASHGITYTVPGASGGAKK